MAAASPPVATAFEGGPQGLGWGLAGLLAAGHFAAFVDRALPAVTAPLIQAELGLDDEALGALQGPAFVGLYVIGLLLAGHLVSRANPWFVAGTCVVCWTLGGGVFALAADLGGLTLGRVLLGAGQSAFAPAALMLIGAQADPDRRSRMLSMFTAGSATGRSGAMLLGGGLLAGLGGAAVAGLDSWRVACLVMIAPNLLLAAGLFAAGRRAPRPERGERPGLGRALAAIRRRPGAFLTIAACGAGCVLLVQAAGAWAPSILHRAHGLSPAEAAMVFGVVVLVFAPTGHLSAGWLIGGAARTRVGTGAILAAACLLAAAGAGGLALASHRVAGVACLGLLTLSGGAAAAVTLVTVQEMTEAALKPAMGALFLVVTSVVGVAGGPWITGALSDSLSADGQALARSLALVIAPTALLVAGLALASTRTWRRAAAS